MTKTLTKRVIAGAILAGGKATRMGGIAKGMLEIEKGISIVEHLIEQFHLAGIHNIAIIANALRPYEKYSVPIFKDIRKGIGPLGGIETALIRFADQCDAVMFAPCDMPNLTASELSTLKEAFIRTASPLVCAETTEFFWHPLCSVVHNALASDIASAIDCGEKTVHKIWKQLDVERIYFSNVSSFINLNSISDARKWRKERNEKANVC